MEQGLLYDFYGELLTEHQKKIYEDAVFNDMSLSEIAEEAKISRQGVHDLIKRCDRSLQEYEEKLHLLERFLKTKKTVGAIHALAESMLAEQNKSGVPDEAKVKIAKITELSKQLIEEL